jgi:hypothetical protein
VIESDGPIHADGEFALFGNWGAFAALLSVSSGLALYKLWLGTVYAVQPTFTPENRHRFHFHRQPY